MPSRPTLFTIGYEGATVDTFLRALADAGVELLVDVRAVALSRRPGFAKTKLAAHLEEAGIGYRHFRRLGTPADGRARARAGDDAGMREIFLAHLATTDAQSQLDDLAALVAAGRRVCILCLEADARRCHRLLVADALGSRMALQVRHLAPG